MDNSIQNLTPLRNRVQVWQSTTEKKDNARNVSEKRQILIDKITDKIIERLDIYIDDSSLKKRARWEVNKMLDGKDKISPEVSNNLYIFNCSMQDIEIIEEKVGIAIKKAQQQLLKAKAEGHSRSVMALQNRSKMNQSMIEQQKPKIVENGGQQQSMIDLQAMREGVRSFNMTQPDSRTNSCLNVIRTQEY